MFYFGLSRPKRASLPRRRSLGFVRAGTRDEPLRTSALEATKGPATMYFMAVKNLRKRSGPSCSKHG